MMMKIVLYIHRVIRSIYYSLLSNHKLKCRCIQPVLAIGEGSIYVHPSVILGTVRSPYFTSGYIYIDARTSSSSIHIGEGTVINNNAVIISDQLTISIGKLCLIGLNFNVINSDFHGIEKNTRRGQASVKRKDVTIGDNVFVGNNVSILKGVIVGNNVVIANGSIVTKSIPDNAIVGGNPARIIRYL